MCWSSLNISVKLACVDINTTSKSFTLRAHLCDVDLVLYYGLNSVYVILYDQLLYCHKEIEHCSSIFLHY
jgi:hypothetical protein